MRLIALVFLLAGCTVTPADTGDRGSVDAGDLGSSNRPALLCTTDACARSPCTVGCVFAAPDCTDGLTSTIETSKVLACSNFCGLFTVDNALGCGFYNGAHPGCEACGSRWGAPSCVDIKPQLDYKKGGVICESGCFDGTAPADLSFDCSNRDMYPHD